MRGKREERRMTFYTPKPGAPADRAQDEPGAEGPRPLIADLRGFLERERRRTMERLRDLDDLLGRPQTLGPRRKREQ